MYMLEVDGVTPWLVLAIVTITHKSVIYATVIHAVIYARTMHGSSITSWAPLRLKIGRVNVLLSR